MDYAYGSNVEEPSIQIGPWYCVCITQQNKAHTRKQSLPLKVWSLITRLRMDSDRTVESTEKLHIISHVFLTALNMKD